MYMYFTSVVNEKAASSTTNEDKTENEANTNSKKKSPKKGKKTSGGTVNMDQKSNDVLVYPFSIPDLDLTTYHPCYMALTNPL
jgi:hypothetical protein